MATTRRWLRIGSGIAVSVTTILSLFIFLQLTYNFQIEDLTGNIYCEGTYKSPCISEFKVINPNNYDVDIYSKDQVKLEFVPGIYDYALFTKDLRCGSTGKCACELNDGRILGFKGWRCTDFTNKTKPRTDKEYNFRFTRYSTTAFRLAGIKNDPGENIKWSLTSPENGTLDPFWYSITGPANISATEIYIELGSQVNITANLTFT